MDIQTTKISRPTVNPNFFFLYTNCEFFNCLSDEHEYRRLVLWLEEQSIRHYQVADREALREIDGDKWQGQFELYLKSLDCPYVGNHVQALSWLLGTALQLEEHSGISDKNPHHQDAFTNIDGKSKKKMSLSIIGNEKSRRFFLPDMEQKSRGLFFLSDVGGDFLLFYTEFLQHLSVLNWPLQPLQPLKITCRFFKFTFRESFFL